MTGMSEIVFSTVAAARFLIGSDYSERDTFYVVRTFKNGSQKSVTYHFDTKKITWRGIKTPQEAVRLLMEAQVEEFEQKRREFERSL